MRLFFVNGVAPQGGQPAHRWTGGPFRAAGPGAMAARRSGGRPAPIAFRTDWV
ncbi:MAG: hypothetical protein V7637_5302 [Mycobacteriales bacterium]|jgi:hypothetical protein